MKQFSLAFLLFAFTLAMVTPDTAFAKRGGDDDNRYEYNDDYDDDDDDRDDDDNSNDELEVEADVFTDTTIVKVELENGRKTVFTTSADTRAEVIEVVADRFNLTESEVDDALDFEIEDRASRVKDRAKISDRNNRPIDTCDDDNSNDELEVEADVFTDTTIVKVELENGRKTVFTTSADTRAEVIEVVADRFNLTESEVDDALDFEIEDRASRVGDRVISSSDDDCDDNSNNNNNGGSTDAELKNRIAELQRLLQALVQLFNLRFGN